MTTKCERIHLLNSLLGLEVSNIRTYSPSGFVRYLAVPLAIAIPGTSLCVVDGWEYAPRWSTPDNGFLSASLEDCAVECETDPVCTGATYITNNDGNNCWFKDWGAGPVPPPCLPGPDSPLQYQVIIDPAGAACSGIVYMDTTVYDCDVEAQIDDVPPVESETAANATSEDVSVSGSTYSRFPGKDYIPSTAFSSPVPAKEVSVQVLNYFLF